jgi:hypothetical protein
MPSTDAPTWWADVQQEREDLAGPGRRPADDWLGEDIEFVPRRRISRREATAGDDGRPAGAAHPLHGVFVPAHAAAATDDDGVAHELRHLRAADDPFATPPPPPGARRTVQIKGRPSEFRGLSRAQRHRGRTASDRVGPRPDRIALWAVVLGAILIILAATSSSSQAAVAHRAAAPQVAAAKVAHAAHHAPVRLVRAHR